MLKLLLMLTSSGKCYTITYIDAVDFRYERDNDDNKNLMT